MHFWKRMVVWFERLGTREQWRAHADFRLDPGESLTLVVYSPAGEPTILLEHHVETDEIRLCHVDFSLEVFPACIDE